MILVIIFANGDECSHYYCFFILVILDTLMIHAINISNDNILFIIICYDDSFN